MIPRTHSDGPILEHHSVTDYVERSLRDIQRAAANCAAMEFIRSSRALHGLRACFAAEGTPLYLSSHSCSPPPSSPQSQSVSSLAPSPSCYTPLHAETIASLESDTPLCIPPLGIAAIQKLLPSLNEALHAWQAQQQQLLQERLKAFHVLLLKEAAQLDDASLRFLDDVQQTPPVTEAAAPAAASGTSAAAKLLFFVLRCIAQSTLNKPMFVPAGRLLPSSAEPLSSASAQREAPPTSSASPASASSPCSLPSDAAVSAACTSAYPARKAASSSAAVPTSGVATFAEAVSRRAASASPAAFGVESAGDTAPLSNSDSSVCGEYGRDAAADRSASYTQHAVCPALQKTFLPFFEQMLLFSLPLHAEKERLELKFSPPLPTISLLPAAAPSATSSYTSLPADGSASSPPPAAYAAAAAASLPSFRAAASASDRVAAQAPAAAAAESEKPAGSTTSLCPSRTAAASAESSAGSSSSSSSSPRSSSPAASLATGMRVAGALGCQAAAAVEQQQQQQQEVLLHPATLRKFFAYAPACLRAKKAAVNSLYMFLVNTRLNVFCGAAAVSEFFAVLQFKLDVERNVLLPALRRVAAAADAATATAAAAMVECELPSALLAAAASASEETQQEKQQQQHRGRAAALAATTESTALASQRANLHPGPHALQAAVEGETGAAAAGAGGREAARSEGAAVAAARLRPAASAAKKVQAAAAALTQSWGNALQHFLVRELNVQLLQQQEQQLQQEGEGQQQPEQQQPEQQQPEQQQPEQQQPEQQQQQQSENERGRRDGNDLALLASVAFSCCDLAPLLLQRVLLALGGLSKAAAGPLSIRSRPFQRLVSRQQQQVQRHREQKRQERQQQQREQQDMREREQQQQREQKEWRGGADRQTSSQKQAVFDGLHYVGSHGQQQQQQQHQQAQDSCTEEKASLFLKTVTEALRMMRDFLFLLEETAATKALHPDSSDAIGGSVCRLENNSRVEESGYSSCLFVENSVLPRSRRDSSRSNDGYGEERDSNSRPLFSSSSSSNSGNRSHLDRRNDSSSNRSNNVDSWQVCGSSRIERDADLAAEVEQAALAAAGSSFFEEGAAGERKVRGGFGAWRRWSTSFDQTGHTVAGGATAAVFPETLRVLLLLSWRVERTGMLRLSSVCGVVIALVDHLLMHATTTSSVLPRSTIQAWQRCAERRASSCCSSCDTFALPVSSSFSSLRSCCCCSFRCCCGGCSSCCSYSCFSSFSSSCCSSSVQEVRTNAADSPASMVVLPACCCGRAPPFSLQQQKKQEQQQQQQQLRRALNLGFLLLGQLLRLLVVVSRCSSSSNSSSEEEQPRAERHFAAEGEVEAGAATAAAEGSSSRIKRASLGSSSRSLQQLLRCCLRRFEWLECLTCHIDNPSATCTLPQTTALARDARCPEILLSIALSCSSMEIISSTSTESGEAAPPLAQVEELVLTERQLQRHLQQEEPQRKEGGGGGGGAATAAVYDLPQLFADMQKDRSFFERTLEVLLSPDHREAEFLLYRLPFSLAKEALRELLQSQPPSAARRRWPLYVLLAAYDEAAQQQQQLPTGKGKLAQLGSLGAAERAGENWLEAASQLVVAPGNSGLIKLAHALRFSADDLERAEVFTTFHSPAPVIPRLYAELLLAASQQQHPSARLFFLSLAKRLAQAAAIELPNSSARMQQQLQHLRLQHFPTAALEDDVTLDYVAALLQASSPSLASSETAAFLEESATDRHQITFAAVVEHLEEQVFVLLDGTSQAIRTQVRETLRQAARLLPSLILAEALPPAVYRKFWQLVLLVDAPAYPLALSSAREHLATPAAAVAAGSPAAAAAASVTVPAGAASPWGAATARSSSTMGEAERYDDVGDEGETEKDSCSFFDPEEHGEISEEMQKKANKQGTKEYMDHWQRQQGSQDASMPEVQEDMRGLQKQQRQRHEQQGQRPLPGCEERKRKRVRKQHGQDEQQEEKEEEVFVKNSALLDCLLFELLRSYGPGLLALDPAGEAPDSEFYQAVYAVQHHFQTILRRWHQRRPQQQQDLQQQLLAAPEAGTEEWDAAAAEDTKEETEEEQVWESEKRYREAWGPDKEMLEEEDTEQQQQQHPSLVSRRCCQKDAQHKQDWRGGQNHPSVDKETKQGKHNLGDKGLTHVLNEAKRSLTGRRRVPDKHIDVRAAVHLVLNAYLQEQEDLLNEQEESSPFALRSHSSMEK